MLIYKKNLKSNGITDLQRELLYAKTKNKIDEQYMMRITEKMRQMFKDNELVQKFPVFDDPNKLNFEQITRENIPKRTITEEEYNALPTKNKNSKTIIPRAILQNITAVIIFGAFLGVNIYTISYEKPLSAAILLPTMALVMFIIMMVFIINTVKKMKDKIVKPDDKISKGNVIAFRDVPSKTSRFMTSLYYADVAFYDEKKFVKKIQCSRKIYNMLSLDSEVIIHNSRIYIYDKDGNLICD